MNVTFKGSLQTGSAAEVQDECTAQLAKRILEITGKNANAGADQSVTNSVH